MALTLPDIRDRATITVAEAGEVLTLSRTSIYAAVKNGDVPTIRIGRRLVVPVPVLLRMLGDDGPARVDVTA